MSTRCDRHPREGGATQEYASLLRDYGHVCSGRLRCYLLTSPHCCFAVESSATCLVQVVAYAIFTTTQLAVQLTKLGVHPSFRRKGVARSLLQVLSSVTVVQAFSIFVGT